jgi:hypothetical protein
MNGHASADGIGSHRTYATCVYGARGGNECVRVLANIVEVAALAVFDRSMLHVRGGIKRKRLSAHRSATLTQALLWCWCTQRWFGRLPHAP